MSAPLFVGIAGGSASGKTLVCDNIIRQLRDNRVVVVGLDSFYKDLRPEDSPDSYNFDHPNAFDLAELKTCLLALKARKPTAIPRYDFTTNSRIRGEQEFIECADVVLVEGILTLYEDDIRSLYDMRIYVEEENDVCLIRRLRRDVKERGKPYLDVLAQYEKNVKPMFDTFVHPQRKYADVIVTQGGHNKVAIDMLCRHIKSWLQENCPGTPTPWRQGACSFLSPN